MKEITINAQARTEYGKKASRDLRRAGQIPAVFYGVEKGENGLPVAKSIQVSEKELAKLLYTPNVYIVNLVVDGKSVKAILKDLQCDFVTDRPVHVDFYQITEDKPVVFEIPVKLNGLAEGVRAGGKLTLNVRKLAVKALYTQFPDTLDIDVTNLGLGKAMKVAELSYEGLEIITSKEAEAININKVYQFTKSKIWNEMIQAKEVQREKPFYINIPAKEIYNDDLDEKVLVQGVIDLYYITQEDELILVDFKTDFVENRDERILIDKYKTQLELYRRAIESALDKKVDKIFIYSTYLEREILL